MVDLLPRGAFGLRRVWAAAWVAALVSVAAPCAATAQSGDTVHIVNQVSARFLASDGHEGTSEATSTVAVKVSAGIRLAPPRSAALVPGQRRVFSHLLENVGTGADRYTLGVAAPAGWSVKLYVDVDGDGVLGAGDLLVTSPVPVGARQSATLLVVVDVPADAPDMGSATIDITATSAIDPSVTASVRDTVSVRRPLAALSLNKTVNLTDATPGDTLRYTLSFANAGDGASGAAEVTDTLVAALRVVPGSVTLNGVALTDAVDGDAGSVARTPDGRDLVRVNAGAIDAGASGSISFRAVIGAGAGASVANSATLATARLEYSGPMGANSPVVETQLVRPTLTLSKERMGEDTVRVGGQTEYRLNWTNTSATVAARNVFLVDTLPAGLEFIRADRTPEVVGQVVRWSLGTIAGGETGSLTLAVRVVARAEDGRMVNRATMGGSNASPVTAEAGAVRSLGFMGTELGITKAAGVLEASIGDAVPYTLVVENRAQVTVRNAQVVDLLPAGLHFVEGNLVGADSARVEGRTLRLWLGDLAAGSTRTVAYRVKVQSPGAARALENRAMATAEGGMLSSDTASAWIRMRSGFALQVRTLVGKVWLDTNDNGRQETGERGIAGVDVWSADGEVATTDREGRYSFRDVRVGTHAVRVDTVGMIGGYRLARSTDAIQRIRMDGWTTPRADFRFVPVAGAVAGNVMAAPNSPAEITGGGPASGGAVTGGDTPLTSAPSRGVAGNDAPLTSAPGRGNPAAAASALAAPLAAPLAASSRAATVAPARTAEARAADEAQSFARGPAVRFFAPADGTIIGSDKLFVGVKGEPGRPVRLFDGDSLIAEQTLRPDGVADFIGVTLKQGPHRLRVVMQNSWNQERTDTLAIHHSGAAARFELPSAAASLHAGDTRGDTVRVRVLDRWNVPVVTREAVTVESSLAESVGADEDVSSAGRQLRPDSAGFLAVPLRPGHAVGAGELRLSAGKLVERMVLRVLPSTRPLIATGYGQVGIGAAPGAFGAVTVKGAVGHETTVSVSVDSRRGQEGDDFFARGYDPNDESRYPVFGDNSERRFLSSSTQKVSARIERGFDYLALGDVESNDFGGDPRLGVYSRSLTGAAGRVSTGALTFKGFGSLTDQVLAQRQVRANGTSGPYRFGGSVRPGTDRVAIEVRARDNAARVISREEILRWTDYQIDYSTGEVLLQRAVPSYDGAGNPVYVVAILENRSGGERRMVGGLRVELDAMKALGMRGTARDTVSFSVMGVHDAGDVASGFGGQEMLGTGLRVRRGGMDLSGELLRAQRPDSSAFAGRAEASYTFFGERARLSADWLLVGAGFAPGTDPRLSAGVQEIRLGGDFRVTERNTIGITHERQRFEQYGMDRSRTSLHSQNLIAGRSLTTEASMTTDADGNGSTSAAVAKMTLDVTERARVWVEGTRDMSGERPLGQGGSLPTRPDQMGVGASYRLFGNTSVEGSHRWVTAADSLGGSYGLSGFNLRTSVPGAGQMWGGLERANTENAQHSAVLGWNHRMSITGGLSVHASAERRFGLERAATLDPVRSLPFARQERDHWSTSAGFEFLPTDSSMRMSARTEVHGGVEAQGYRIDVAGDLPLGASAALVTRHDWWKDTRILTGGSSALAQEARRDRSMLGLAMRPAQHNNLNVLAKLEWRNTVNPLVGSQVLSAGNALNERRLIAAGDAIWDVRPGSELGMRYAARWSGQRDSVMGPAEYTNLAHFLGGRVNQELRGPLALRVDARMLMGNADGRSSWNLAPALVGRLGQNVEVEGGYRFGTLSDLDFAQQGGRGFYVTLGVRFTERLLKDPASFWRERIAQDGN